jgi:hypothetical protein
MYVIKMIGHATSAQDSNPYGSNIGFTPILPPKILILNHLFYVESPALLNNSIAQSNFRIYSL